MSETVKQVIEGLAALAREPLGCAGASSRATPAFPALDAPRRAAEVAGAPEQVAPVSAGETSGRAT
jgi:hypothetical protein